MIASRVRGALISTSICSNEIATDRRDKIHKNIVSVIHAAEAGYGKTFTANDYAKLEGALAALDLALKEVE